MRDTTRWLRTVDLDKAVDIEASLYANPWNRRRFEKFMSGDGNRILGMFRGKELLGYICFVEFRRRISVERMIVQDRRATGGDVHVIITLIESIKEMLPTTHTVRIEMEIDFADQETLKLLKDLDFKSEPWVDGTYIHSGTQRLLMVHRPSGYCRNVQHDEDVSA